MLLCSVTPGLGLGRLFEENSPRLAVDDGIKPCLHEVDTLHTETNAFRARPLYLRKLMEAIYTLGAQNKTYRHAPVDGPGWFNPLPLSKIESNV